MSLYIRLMLSFWHHRKTARLRAILGDDALWILPRLWSYAAENQPDGNFSNYSTEEIAMLIECSKHATSIKQSLIDSGFMDSNGNLHDWNEHNGYHSAYSERAKTAAKARWEKKEKKTDKDRDRIGKETSIASSMLVASPPPPVSSTWTLEQCKAAAIPIGMTNSDVEAFWAHYASVDFIDAAGRKITHLAAALAKWKSGQSSHGKFMTAKQAVETARKAAKPDTRQLRDDAIRNVVDHLAPLQGTDEMGRAMSADRDKYKDFGKNQSGQSVLDEALDILEFRRNHKRA